MSWGSKRRRAAMPIKCCHAFVVPRRGGAGYPTGLKWATVAQSPGKNKYVICNADEGDPGAFMDRSVLESDPPSPIVAACPLPAQDPPRVLLGHGGGRAADPGAGGADDAARVREPAPGAEPRFGGHRNDQPPAGLHLMATRESLQFESAIESDCASLVEPVLALLGAGIDIHCLRDSTRGGAAGALHEIAEVAPGNDPRQ